MRLNQRIKKKYRTAIEYLPEPYLDKVDGASVGLIAVGSTEGAIAEARDYLARRGLATDFLRIRAIPFHPSVREFITEHESNYVIEINRDGQLHQLLTLEVPDLATRLVSISHSDGLPLTARWIEEEIMEREG